MLDQAFGGGTAGPLPRLGHALLAQETLRSLEVAARLLEGALAVHHPRTCLVAELLDELRRDLSHRAAPPSPSPPAPREARQPAPRRGSPARSRPRERSRPPRPLARRRSPPSGG